VRLDEVLGDERWRRRLFPVVARHVYLAHAAVAPLPAWVADSVAGHVGRASREGQFDRVVDGAESGVRELSAGLLGVRSGEIALVPSTSAGLAMVAEGLTWHPGDVVVVEKDHFPANIYPWLALRRLGVEVRAMPCRDEALGFADLESHLDDRTRLVAVSSAHYVSGRPLRDLPGIGRELRRRGILLCVDAIQTLGAQRLCAGEVDYLVADGHKWLLAPKGLGILYVRHELMGRLRPVLTGWRSVARPGDFSVQTALAETARRYEPGSLNECGLVGLRAALELLETFGHATIEERVRLLRLRLVAGLTARGAVLVGHPESHEWSGVVSFRLADEPATVTVERLRQHGVIVSLRHSVDGRPVVRLAPHFYNTEPELECFFDILDLAGPVVPHDQLLEDK
jgi:cysteine desulfurase / selenocysteine lyase